MSKSEILVVDDSKAILATMKSFLEEEGYEVTTALTAEQALTLISKKRFHLVIMDIRLPGMSGLDALTQIKKIDPKLSVIIMTAYGTIDNAIEAMKKGAYEYVTKPFKFAELKTLIIKSVKAGKLMKEAVSFQITKKEDANVDVIVGKSPAMLEIYKTIGKVADSNATVLIRGESGTGKELAARAIYQNSLRRDKPFLAVNCAAIPESLLESELFGHERGAFTGAINKRVGKFQQCNTGTIFLDEIGDMSLSTQTKILRVLQQHTFEPVGSEGTVKVDVRVIASTNKDLTKAMEKGEFREDLYYRLKVITVFMPPLRDKREDIPLLVDYFIRKFNREFNKNIKKVSPEVIAHFMKFPWPGNVRELENAIQTAVIMSKRDILLLDNFPLFTAGVQTFNRELSITPVSNYEKLFQDIVTPILKDSSFFDSGQIYKKIMGGLEKTLIAAVLNEANGNQIKAARILGISRNTLRVRMKEYSLMT